MEEYNEPLPEVPEIIEWKKDKKTTDAFLEKIQIGQRPLKVGYMNESDNKLCYDFVALDKIVDKESKEGETPITAIDGNKINYDIPINENIKKNFDPKLAFVRNKENNKLPLSFLSIKEGEVEKGKNWYLQNDPKLPEDIAELMARYSFGDLKNMTKKDAKNRRKKLAKKGKTIYEDNKLSVKKGKFIVDLS